MSGYLSDFYDGELTSEQLWENLPNPCFPELSSPTIAITDNRIIIHDEECEWAFQSDIIIADGSGSMIFEFEDEIFINILETGGSYESSSKSTINKIVTNITSLEMIERGEPYWVFKGRSNDNARIEIKAKVKKITWNYEPID